MEMGVVRTFHKDRRYGSLISLATNAEFDFKLHNGGVFVSRGGTPFLVGSTSPHREPRKDDLVLFEHADTPKGKVVTDWGLYQSFRDAYQPLLEPLIPKYALAEYPFLIDVLIKGKRFILKQGPFTCKSEPLSRSVYRTTPYDDLIGGMRVSAFFVAKAQSDGAWLIQELKNDIFVKNGEAHVCHAADPIRSQILDLGIDLVRNASVLVRMDIDEHFGEVSSNKKRASRIGVETRDLTVFL